MKKMKAFAADVYDNKGLFVYIAVQYWAARYWYPESLFTDYWIW